MKKRFEAELEQRLDQVEDLGSTMITNLEIRRWFERERITRIVWDEIQSMWAERENEAPLFVGNNDNHTYTIIWGAGLTADSEAYFRPIAEMAG